VTTAENILTEINALANGISHSKILQSNIENALETNSPVTFFRWTIFNITRTDQQNMQAAFTVDPQASASYIAMESQLRAVLERHHCPFKHILLCPDDFVSMVFPELTTDTPDYQNQLQGYLNNLRRHYLSQGFANIQTYTLSQLLATAQLTTTYKNIYDKITNSFDKDYFSPYVSKTDFEREVEWRKRMYNRQQLAVPNHIANELARRTFGAFFAETTCLYHLATQRICPNLALLSRLNPNEVDKHRTIDIPEQWHLPRIFLLKA